METGEKLCYTSPFLFNSCFRQLNFIINLLLYNIIKWNANEKMPRMFRNKNSKQRIETCQCQGQFIEDKHQKQNVSWASHFYGGFHLLGRIFYRMLYTWCKYMIPDNVASKSTPSILCSCIKLNLFSNSTWVETLHFAFSICTKIWQYNR